MLKQMCRAVLVVFGLVSSGSGPAWATAVQVSNLSESQDFQASVVGAAALNTVTAGKFTTDGERYFVKAASAVFVNGGSNGEATYWAGIYEDAGATPGALVAVFDDNPALPEGTETATEITFTTAGIELDPDTSYWLAVGNDAGTNHTWTLTASDAESAPGGWTIDDSASARSSDSGANWNDVSGSFGGLVPLFEVEAVSAIQVSNLSEPEDFQATVTGSVTNVVTAGKFTTDSHGYLVTAASAVFVNGGTNGEATYWAGLYEDAGAIPGNLVAVFDDFPTLPEGTNTATEIRFTSAGIEIDPDTSYWLAIGNDAGTIHSWTFTGSDAESAPGGWTIDDSASARSIDSGANWNDLSGSFGGLVPLFEVEALPEPGRDVLFGVGLLLVAKLRRTKSTTARR